MTAFSNTVSTLIGRAPSAGPSRLRYRRGAFARTAVSLVGLGLASAVFGAVIIGPAIGKRLSDAPSASPKTSAPSATERFLQAALSHKEDVVSKVSGFRGEDQSREDSRSSSKLVNPNEDATHGVVRAVSSTTTERESTRDPFARTVSESTSESPTVSTTTTHAALKGRDDEPATRSGARLTPAAEDATEAPARPAKSRRERDLDSPVDNTAVTPAHTARTHRVRDLDPDATKPAADEGPHTRPIATIDPEPRAVTPPSRRAPKAERTAEPRVASTRPTTAPDKTHAEATPAETDEHAASESDAETAKLYRVRVGKFESREDAEKLRDELKETAGVTAFLVKVPDGYQVQTGAYKRRSNAEKIAGTLRSHSYRPKVTQE